MKSRADLCTIEGFDSLDVDTSSNPCVWRNSYFCDTGCNIDWEDTWSCKCDDKCPSCDAPHEPEESEWIGPADSTLRALWEALPEAGSDEPSPLDGRSRRPSLTIAELASLLVELGPEDSPDRNPLYVKIRDILLEELDPAHREMSDAYRNAVPVKDGELECDTNNAEVSVGDDPGAYVMTWTWVTAAEAGRDFKEEDDEPSA
jgi:hypothetical protein